MVKVDINIWNTDWRQMLPVLHGLGQLGRVTKLPRMKEFGGAHCRVAGEKVLTSPYWRVTKEIRMDKSHIIPQTGT
jgi:hypothetical protein